MPRVPYEQNKPVPISYEARLANAIHIARNGDPFPFIEIQWPDIVIDDFQKDIIRSIFSPEIKEVFIKGCTKPGKGFAVAMAINIWFDIWPNDRIIIQSNNYTHAVNVMFAEVQDVRKMMRFKGPAKPRRDGYFHTSKHFMTVYNPADETGAAFSGQHGDHTMFVFDEGSAVSETMYKNAQKQSRMIVALSNPRVLSGWFRRGFDVEGVIDPDVCQTVQIDYGYRRLITVGGGDCMNVRMNRLELPIAPIGGIEIEGRVYNKGERISQEDFEKVRLIIPKQLDLGRYRAIMAEPDQFQRDVFGAGKFPVDDLDATVIAYGWLSRHIDFWKRHNKSFKVDAFGLDISVGGTTKDVTVLAPGSAQGCKNLHISRHRAVNDVVNWVVDVADTQYGINLLSGENPISVDANGVGKGVADLLESNGAWTIPVNGSGAADTGKDRYGNKRAEMYGELGRRMNPNSQFEKPWGIPDDEELHQELVCPKKYYPPRADSPRFFITPKRKLPGQISKGPTIEEQINRSPDKADAVSLLYNSVRSMEQGSLNLVDDATLLIMTEQEISDLDGPQEEEQDPIAAAIAALLKSDEQDSDPFRLGHRVRWPA